MSDLLPCDVHFCDITFLASLFQRLHFIAYLIQFAREAPAFRTLFKPSVSSSKKHKTQSPIHTRPGPAIPSPRTEAEQINQELLLVKSISAFARVNRCAKSNALIFSASLRETLCRLTLRVHSGEVPGATIPGHRSLAKHKACVAIRDRPVADT
jgi:hypothetical protein